MAFVEQPEGFGRIEHEQPVDQEPGALPDQDRGLAQAPGEGGHAARGLRARVAPHDHLHQRHLVDRIEEVHPHDPATVGGVLSDRVDRQRGGVGSEDRRGSEAPVEVGEDLLLDRQVLDHGFDDEIAGRQPRVLERRLEQVHLALHRGGLEPAARDLFREQSGGMTQRRPERLRLDVLDPHRQARLVGDQLRDAASHHSGAEHRRMPDLGGRRAVVPLRRLHETEDVDEVLGDGGHGELAQGACLGLESGRAAAVETDPDDLDRPERCGIAALRLGPGLGARLTEHEAAPERIALEQETFEPTRAARPAPLADARQRPVAHALVEPGVGQQDVGEAEAEGARAGDVARGQDHVQGGEQPDATGQAGAPAPAGEDPQPHLRQPDPQVRSIGRRDPGRGERELRTAAQARAADGGDGREGQSLPGGEQAVPEARAGLGLGGVGDPLDLVDVGAGDEDAFLGRAQDEDGDVGASAQLGEQRLQLGEHRAVEDVRLLLGQVEGQGGEPVGPHLEMECAGHD